MRGFAHLLVLIFVIVLFGAFIYLTVDRSPFRNNIISLLESRFYTQAATATDTSYAMKTLVIKYFPVASGSNNIDINVTGDVGEPYDAIRQRTISITNNLVTLLTKASIYLGYKDTNAQPALNYEVVGTIEHKEAVPFDPNTRIPLYNQIMTDHNICDYVDNQGVREVWMWAYQGPVYPGTNNSYLSISESKMSGPFGDISNSFRTNDMPLCKNTYRLYVFNYGRGTAEAMESWGHQMEAELSAVDQNLYRTLFQGPNYPQTLNGTGRCGSVHNPPNARNEYDRGNPTPQNSDCLDWKPDSLGSLSAISCSNWGCQDLSDSNNSALNYMVWNWQNLPGRNNTKTYQGQSLRNWWDVHGDFDKVMGGDRELVLPSPSSSPVQMKTIVSDKFDRADNTATLGQTDTGQNWESVKGSWGISNNLGYPAYDCPAPGYAVVDSQNKDGIFQITLVTNPQDVRIPFRMVDVNNLYWVERRGGNPPYYDINKLVNGVHSILAQSNVIVPKDGDLVTIKLNGSAISVSINGTTVMTARDTSLAGTKYGIGTWCSGSVRFDNYNFSIPVLADTTSPAVNVDSPVGGSEVKGLVPVAVTATDDVAVSKVEIYADDILMSTSTTEPYQYSWDSTSVINGAHTFSALAYDSSGNVAKDQVSVIVANGDKIAPTQPTQLQATVLSANSVALKWTASTDNVGVKGYWIVRNGVTIGSSTLTSFTDNTVAAATSYGYQVIAFDAAANTSVISGAVTVTTPEVPDTQAPTIPAGLVATAVSSSQINLSWSSSTDNKNVVGYQVYRNDVQIATLSATSLGDTGLSASSQYSYYVKAYDGAGNLSAASTTVSAKTMPLPVINGSISGTVIGVNNKPLSGAYITIYINGAAQLTRANSLGAYSIGGLVPNTYTVNYAGNGYKSQTLRITVGNGQKIIQNVTFSKR